MVNKRFSTFYIGKKPFWTTKASVSKTHKICIFAKGLLHCFGQKFEIFWSFLLCKIHPEKVFGGVLVTKQAFLDNIKHGFKKKAKLAFLQGDSAWFWSKSYSFLIFCVYQKYIEKKCFLTFQIKKKALKTIKITVYEKRKIRIFRKGLVHRFGKKFEISTTLNFYAK